MIRRKGLVRESGSLMIELVVALSIVTVGLLAFVGAFMSNFKGVNTMNELDETHIAFENVAELLTSQTFQEVYDTYNGTNIQVPNLVAPDGSPAVVQITCYLDESKIPAEFGPITDLDGNPGGDIVVPTTLYKVLPVQLTINYATSNGTESRELYLLLDDED